MVTAKVGQDIEDNCNKCGDVWHVVVAMVGTRVVRVLCKQCSGQHNYKNERRNSATASTTKRSSVKKSKEKAPPALPTVTDPSKPPRAYAFKESYRAGERIAHPKFGVGIVRGSPGPGKIDVVFTDGDRILTCDRTGGTEIERHKPVELSHPADQPPES